MGLVTEKQMAEALSDQLGLPYLDLMSYEVQSSVLDLVE